MVRLDTGYSLDTFYIKKCHFCYPCLTPFGSAVRGKGTPTIASIGQSILGNPKVRNDTGFNIVSFT